MCGLDNNLKRIELRFLYEAIVLNKQKIILFEQYGYRKDIDKEDSEKILMCYNKNSVASNKVAIKQINN